MRKLASLLIGTSFLVSLAIPSFPATPAQDVSPSVAEAELARHQGTWLVESFEREGELTAPEIVRTIRRIVKGKRVIWEREGKTFAATALRLDPTATPAALDVIPEGGPYRDQPVLGIYRLERDRLIICMSDPGKPRPTEFVSEPGSGVTLMSFVRAPEREEPTPP